MSRDWRAQVHQLVDLHYRVLSERGGAVLPIKEEPFALEDAGVPPTMVEGEPDESGWVRWRLVPSGVSESDLAAIDGALPAPLPEALREFLKYSAVLECEQLLMPEVPADAPLKPLLRELHAWSPLLACGYVPFVEMGDGWGPVCYDATSFRDGDAKVVWFDHEHLHALDQPWSRAAVQAFAKPLHGSFADHLGAAEEMVLAWERDRRP